MSVGKSWQRTDFQLYNQRNFLSLSLRCPSAKADTAGMISRKENCRRYPLFLLLLFISFIYFLFLFPVSPIPSFTMGPTVNSVVPI